MATLPTLVAHRGYPLRYPENTLVGIDAAAQAGARWIEFDVQLTRDGVPYLCHDASLKRTAGLDRNILELAAAEFASIDVGEAKRLGGKFAGTHPTPLQELTAWLQRHPRIHAFVEIKRQSLRQFGIDAVIERVMQDLRPALPQCVVISFDSACLEVARRQGSPAIGWAIENADEETAARAEQFKPDYVFAGDRLFPAAKEALKGDWHWVVYEVQDPEYAKRLAVAGAEFVETDAITEMLANLRTP